MKDITDYLRQVYERGGSDLHLSVGAPPAARVDGKLVPLEDRIFSKEEVRSLIMATMTEAHQAKLEENWELDYALQLRGVGRFRGNVHYCRQNLEASYRFIPNEIPDINSLGHHAVVKRLCEIERGLILITGTTGCGKTTTLAGMVKRIASIRAGTIIMLEDPIEYRHQHRASLVKQREIGRDTKSFTRALRQAMRQDPDVIVVGELMDRESMQIALTAAETGHIVIATLHTIDAPKTVERILDMFPPDQQQQVASQLSSVLEGVIAQRLVARPDGSGRVLVSEVMRSNSAIQVCLRDRKIEQLTSLMEIFTKDGNVTIDQALQWRLAKGEITRDDCLKHCRYPENFPEEVEEEEEDTSTPIVVPQQVIEAPEQVLEAPATTEAVPAPPVVEVETEQVGS